MTSSPHPTSPSGSTSPVTDNTGTTPHPQKVWFITGTSRGFGRQFAEAALRRGDQVVATARRESDLADLAAEFGDAVLVKRLDVTDDASVREAVAEAVAHFGRLDVVVNNAGYGLFGAVEELDEEQLRDQFDVNFFGVFRVLKAVLPVLREQGSGHILNVSSLGGLVAFAQLGGYHASKWALEALTDSLAKEVGPLGVDVTLIEPGHYATEWAGPSAVWADPLPAYQPRLKDLVTPDVRADWPDPAYVGAAILSIVDAPEPPLRVLFSEWPIGIVKEEYALRLATWDEWESTTLLAEGKPARA